MKKNRIIGSIILVVVIFFIARACSPRVIITREFVTCSEWKNSEGSDGPSVTIKKIIPFDDLKNKELDAIEVKDIVKNYTIDTSFCYTSGYIPDRSVKKIYFNKKNESFNWRKECYKDMETYVETISLLELDTWYEFDDILEDYCHYVYVDINGETHVFEAAIGGVW